MLAEAHSVPIVEPRALKGPVSGASNPQARAVGSRASIGDVSGRLQSHDQKTLHISEKLRRAAPSPIKNEVTLEHSNLINSIMAPKEVKKVGLVVSMQSLSDGLVVRLADVEDPVAIGMEIGVQAEGCAPARIAWVPQL